MICKKNYEKIAKIIKVNRGFNLSDFEDDGYILPDLIYDLADYFKKDNPRFKKDKFLKACGVE